MAPGVLLAADRDDADATATPSSRSTSGRRASGPSPSTRAGTLLAAARVPIEPYVSPRPGCAEQDPELYWRSIGEATPAPARRPGGPPRRASPASRSRPSAARSSSPTRPATPLRPRSSGSTSCRAANPPTVGGAMGARLPAHRPDATPSRGSPPTARRTGCARPSPRPGRDVRHYLGLSGFLTHRLTGRWVDSTAAQVGYLPFDYKHFRVGRAGRLEVDRGAGRPGLAARAGRPRPSALGELIGRGGRAHRAAGRPAGRSPRPPTRRARSSGPAPSRPDVARALVRHGRDRQRDERPLRGADPAHPAVPGGHPGRRWNLETQVYRGYWMVEWFKREFGDREVAEAAARGHRPGGPLRRARPGRPGRVGRADAPAVLVTGRAHPGAGGARRDHRLQRGPHPGPPVPGDPRGPRLCPARRRGADGQADAACRSRRCGSRAAAHRARPPSSSPRTCSGCRSAAPTRTRPRPWARPSTPPWAWGSTRTSRPPRPRMVRTAETRDPDPAAHARYDELFRAVYRPMYGRLRPLYRELRRTRLSLARDRAVGAVSRRRAPP